MPRRSDHEQADSPHRAQEGLWIRGAGVQGFVEVQRLLARTGRVEDLGQPVQRVFVGRHGRRAPAPVEAEGARFVEGLPAEPDQLAPRVLLGALERAPDAVLRLGGAPHPA